MAPLVYCRASDSEYYVCKFYSNLSITYSFHIPSLSSLGFAFKRIPLAYFCVYSVHKFFKSLNASCFNCLLPVCRFVAPLLCFSGCVPACFSVLHIIGIVCAGCHSELQLLSPQHQPLQQHSPPAVLPMGTGSLLPCRSICLPL